jgi:hypothetical protein
MGLPYDVAVAGLKVWSFKNRPERNKGVITETEIKAQTSYVYSKNYSGYGCGSEAVRQFCTLKCSLLKKVDENNSQFTIG